MTRDEIIELATKVYGECDWHESALNHLEAFAKLVEERAVAKEREACADRAWIALINQSQPWNVRQDVTQAILKRDKQ